MALTSKQARFCEEYIIDLHGRNAAIRAGYSQKTAEVQASRLLRNANISENIKRLIEERSQKTGITAEVILSELYRLARVDISQAFDEAGNFKPIQKIPEDVRRAISSIEVFEEYEGQGKGRVYVGQTKKIKFWDKTKSLELLGKHLQLFVDQIDHRSRDGSMSPREPQVIVLVPSNGSEAAEEDALD